MKKGEIKFTGNFWGFFWASIVGGFLAIITLGLLLPAVMYFQLKYFFENIEIEL